jgi:very-short-patch-repair endonuclease
VEPLYEIRLMADRHHGVVTAEQCRRVGLSPDDVKKQCRRRDWLRLHRGVYSVRGPDPSRKALIMAAVLSAGPAAVAVLATAAELHGLAGARPEPSIHVSLPGAGARPRRATELGIVLHQLTIQPGQVTSVDGIPATTALRTVADLLLRTDRMSAVSLLDSGLNRRLLVPDDLDVICGLITGRRGATRARPWLLESDARAESPLETRVRLRAVDGGVSPDELQFRVHDRAGAIVAIGDLAWLRSRIIAEADGAQFHDTPEAVFHDRKRQNDIINAGYVPLRFTWDDTLVPWYIPDAIRAAMARAVPSKARRS